jgi:hypothetical protein
VVSISEAEKAKQCAVDFKKIREECDELRAQEEHVKAAGWLKLRNDAQERQQKSRLRKYEQDFQDGIRTKDHKLIKNKVCLFAFEALCSVS